MAHRRPRLQQRRYRIPPRLPYRVLSRTRHQCGNRWTSPRDRRSNGSPLNTPWNSLRQKGSKETTPYWNLSGPYSYHSDRPHDKFTRPCRCSDNSWNSRICGTLNMERDNRGSDQLGEPGCVVLSLIHHWQWIYSIRVPFTNINSDAPISDWN